MKTGFHKSTFFALLAAGLACAAPKDTVNVLTSYEQAQGFQLMFDSTAASFRNLFADYQQNSTTNTSLNASWALDTTFIDPDRPGFFRSIKTTTAAVDNRTRKQYRDFDWRIEFRNTGNQGLIYRFDVTQSTSWATGVEFAVDDNSNQNGKYTTGAVYDLIPPTPAATQSYYAFNTGKWNSARIVAKGDSVEHWLNGYKVAGYQYWQGAFLAAYPNSKWTGYNRFCQTASGNKTYIQQGFIGLQGDHSGTWHIRRMRVLNDSVSSMNRVKFGPVDTSKGSTALFSDRNEKTAAYRVERLSHGLRISTAPATLRSVEILALNGSRVRRIQAATGSSELVFNDGGFRKGVYFLRIETSAGIHQGKILIQ